MTPNGIKVDTFEGIPGKSEEEEAYINAGAVLRVTPIKDVKTMIQAFAFAKKSVPKLKLWIMGPTDEDEAYAQECFDLVKALGVEDVEFTGRVNVKDYLGKMDFTLLTSISEGQPLTILESYAAHKPVIATDVGNCRELIYGNDDGFGSAGILTHIMNIEEIAQAMITMTEDQEERERMGEAGYKRVNAFYRIEQMKDVYREIYKELSDKQKLTWTEEPFVLRR
ncbi:MAG: GT4 family glycosyltransferase PelF [Lachnospiraceae bacterium]